MAIRKTALAPHEWYHCYSRGVDKRRTFESTRDYERFIQILYLCNSEEPLHRDNLKRKSAAELFEVPRSHTLVRIATWCLMSNHFHLLLQETAEDGISRFMHKIGTAYSMYFNIKNDRVGGLFVKPFRSKHVPDDKYFRWVVQYIHLNPIEFLSPNWKLDLVKNFNVLEKRLKEYPYSSLPDYCGTARKEVAILDSATLELLRGTLPSLSQALKDMAPYQEELLM